MSEQLVCRVSREQEKLCIHSPAVGRAKLTCFSQLVSGGQIIGEFYKLNRRFDLVLPQDCQGQIVKIKDRSLTITLAYDEPFMWLESATTIVQREKAKETSTLFHNQSSIDAPMDGMFYLSSSPESPSFVQVGDEVLPGQVVGLIEVMKCFYPIKYQGTKKAQIIAINIKNMTAINVGTKLYTIKDD